MDTIELRDMDGLYDVFIKRYRHGHYGTERHGLYGVFIKRHRHGHYGTERHGWSV